MIPLLLLLPLLFLLAVYGKDSKKEESRVVVIAIDGLRWQEVFEGARRDSLMPFLWEMGRKKGCMIGNRNRKSKMEVANGIWKSYAGYSEMLCGVTDDEHIFDNRKQMNLVKDTTIDHVVVEKVFYSRKVAQQFLFNRINGQWMMTSINYKPMYQNMNSSFLKFYGAFATDTAFQACHLHNPVKFTGPDPDDDFSTMTGDIDPETWPAFAPQLPHGMIYNIIYGQKYTESNRKIFVIRGIANGMETSLTFKKIGGKWELIKLNM